LKLIKVIIIKNNHLKTKLKCFYIIKDFRTRIANEKKNLKGKRPREGYFSKNKQLFSCSLLQQLLNEEIFNIGVHVTQDKNRFVEYKKS
jgi:hypothetical protein